MRWSTQWGAPRGNKTSENDSYSQTTWSKILDTTNALIGVAEIIVVARGPLRPLDFAAIGMRTLHSVLDIYRTWTPEDDTELQTVFEDGENGWKYVSPFVSKMAFAGLEVHETAIPGLQKHSKGKIRESAWTATVEGCEIGWVGPPDESSVPNTIWSKNPRAISDLASRRLWEVAGGDKIIRLLGGKNPVPCDLPKDLINTSFLRDTERRVRLFLDANMARSVIMDGEAGVGKSTCACYIAKALDFKTIIVEASDFVGATGDHVAGEDGVTAAAGLTLTQLMKPEVLIVNDIDRLMEDDQLKLLDLLDHTKDYAKLVFATTNNHRKLIEPVRRPGRLDDFIDVPGLSLSEVLEVAPLSTSLAERMIGWPIAYVREMEKRMQVLGEAGKDEIVEVERRLFEAREDASRSSRNTESDEDEGSKAEKKRDSDAYKRLTDFMRQMSLEKTKNGSSKPAKNKQRESKKAPSGNRKPSK